MSVLAFPQELLDLIFDFVAGEKRLFGVLQIRLVCRRFDDTVNSALLRNGRFLGRVVSYPLRPCPKQLHIQAVRYKIARDPHMGDRVRHVMNEVELQLRHSLSCKTETSQGDLQHQLYNALINAHPNRDRLLHDLRDPAERYPLDEAPVPIDVVAAAAALGMTETLRSLLHSMPDLSSWSRLFENPFGAAAATDSVDCLELLYHAWGQTYLPDGLWRISLALAAANDSAAAIGWLRGLPHDAGSMHHGQGLIFAITDICTSGQLRPLQLFCEIVKEQLQIDPDDILGMPLDFAATVGACDIVRYLISLGADPNYRNVSRIALASAVLGGHVSTIRTLLTLGTDPTIKDHCFRLTAFDLALRNGDKAVIEVMSDAMEAAKLIILEDNEVT